MDYYLLTDLAVTMGYHLAMSGAETFRVEDTVHRILRAYGVRCSPSPTASRSVWRRPTASP